MIKSFYIGDADSEAWVFENKPHIMKVIYETVFDFYKSGKDEEIIAKIISSYKKQKDGRNSVTYFALTRVNLSDTLTKCQLYYEELEEYEKCVKLFELKKLME
jgi:hypothetical protein